METETQLELDEGSNCLGVPGYAGHAGHALDRADSVQMFRIAADCVHTSESPSTPDASEDREFLWLSDPSLGCLASHFDSLTCCLKTNATPISRYTLLSSRGQRLSGGIPSEDFPDIEAK